MWAYWSQTSNPPNLWEDKCPLFKPPSLYILPWQTEQTNTLAFLLWMATERYILFLFLSWRNKMRDKNGWYKSSSTVIPSPYLAFVRTQRNLWGTSHLSLVGVRGEGRWAVREKGKTREVGVKCRLHFWKEHQLWSWNIQFKSNSGIYQLCDLGQIISSLWECTFWGEPHKEVYSISLEN